VDVQAHVLSRAERSTDAAEGQPHLVRRKADAFGHLVAIVVQPLGRHDQVDATVLGRCGEPRLRSHERLVLHADGIRTFDRDRTASRRVTVADEQVPEQVAMGMQRRRCDRRLRIDDRRHDLVVDPDGCGGPTSGVRVIRRHRGYRLAAVPHDVRSEHRLVAHLQAVEGCPGHIFGGEHRCHTGDGERRGDVDGPDVRRGMGRAQRCAP